MSTDPNYCIFPHKEKKYWHGKEQRKPFKKVFPYIIFILIHMFSLEEWQENILVKLQDVQQSRAIFTISEKLSILWFRAPVPSSSLLFLSFFFSVSQSGIKIMIFLSLHSDCWKVFSPLGPQIAVPLLVMYSCSKKTWYLVDSHSKKSTN